MFGFFKNNSDYVKKFFFGVLLIVIFKAFDYLAGVYHGIGIFIKASAPFFAALVIAYILNLPVIKLSELIRRIKVPFIQKHSHGISVLLVYVILIWLIGVTLSSLIPAIYENLLEFTKAVPDYVMKTMVQFQDSGVLEEASLPGDMFTINSAMDSLLQIFDVKLIGSYIMQVFSVTSSLINAFIALIGSVYMLMDKNHILKSLEKLIRIIFRGEKADFVIEHAARINTIFTKYIYCRLMCSIICGFACVIVLSLMGVKYAVILGIFIGALDMIPCFGSIISSIIAILITLLTGGFWQALWVGVALLIIQQLDGNLLAPKLMGDSLELRPLWIVIAVFVGGKMFGFMGMLLSVPILAAARMIGIDIAQALEKKQQAREDTT